MSANFQERLKICNKSKNRKGKGDIKMGLQTMTVKEFADFVGVKKSTVYKWKCLKKMPDNLYRKVGNRKLIFIKNEVDKWLNSGAMLIEE